MLRYFSKPGYQTTTPTRNPYSARPNNTLTLSAGHSPIRRMPRKWLNTFVDWDNYRQRHSGNKFFTPHQRQNGDAVGICRHRAVVYEKARHRDPDGGHDPHAAGVNRKWFRSNRQHRKSNTNPLRLISTPEQKQGRHLSWQSPTECSESLKRKPPK